MWKNILKFIYPNVCGFCNKIISEDYTCKSCKEKLKYMYENSRVPISVGNNFDKLICAYKYNGIIRSKILSYKFKNKKYLYRALSERLLELLQEHKNEFDIIIPVPIHFFRYFNRGYNQSELIAKFISSSLNKPLCCNVLKKYKNIKPQSLLNAKNRKNNVLNAYKIANSNLIKGKNILLIDDIYTTGSTVNECSKILKKYGVNKIIVGVVAKATLNSHIAKEEVRWMN